MARVNDEVAAHARVAEKCILYFFIIIDNNFLTIIRHTFLLPQELCCTQPKNFVHGTNICSFQAVDHRRSVFNWKCQLQRPKVCSSRLSFPSSLFDLNSFSNGLTACAGRKTQNCASPFGVKPKRELCYMSSLRSTLGWHVPMTTLHTSLKVYMSLTIHYPTILLFLLFLTFK